MTASARGKVRQEIVSLEVRYVAILIGNLLFRYYTEHHVTLVFSRACKKIGQIHRNVFATRGGLTIVTEDKPLGNQILELTTLNQFS